MKANVKVKPKNICYCERCTQRRRNFAENNNCQPRIKGPSRSKLSLSFVPKLTTITEEYSENGTQTEVIERKTLPEKKSSLSLFFLCRRLKQLDLGKFVKRIEDHKLEQGKKINVPSSNTVAAKKVRFEGDGKFGEEHFVPNSSRYGKSMSSSSSTDVTKLKKPVQIVQKTEIDKSPALPYIEQLRACFSMKKESDVYMKKESSGVNMKKESSGVNIKKESSGVNMKKESGANMKKESDHNMKEESSGVNMKKESSGVNMIKESSGVNMKKQSSGVNMKKESSGVNMKKESGANMKKESDHNMKKESSGVNMKTESGVNMKKESSGVNMKKKSGVNIKKESGDHTKMESTTQELRGYFERACDWLKRQKDMGFQKFRCADPPPKKVLPPINNTRPRPLTRRKFTLRDESENGELSRVVHKRLRSVHSEMELALGESHPFKTMSYDRLRFEDTEEEHYTYIRGIYIPTWVLT